MNYKIAVILLLGWAIIGVSLVLLNNTTLRPPVMVLHVDSRTGCHWLLNSKGGRPTARVDIDANHVGCIPNNTTREIFK